MKDNPNREWLTVAEFLRAFPQMSRTLTYGSIQKGRIPSIKIGGKILVPSDALDMLLEAKTAEVKE
tara:strand:+ start:536 stop:733 length:198 start_codon:yes stop_codon:yes gene_type:complete